MKEKILVTTALPYANGPIHLGHLLEAVQADIWVRYQKAKGNDCYFFCADDTHGTPVMLAAQKAGITPEELVTKIHKEHYNDLSGFHIDYDNYYTTNSPENQKYAEEIYTTLKQKGHISSRDIEQSYCEHDKMFLPDRFIKGTCPKCGAKDQYGDGCESCGANYSPNDLLDSRCAICGNTPTVRSSKHLFFKLQDFEKPLLAWIQDPSHVQEGVSKKLQEWFDSGLQEWDISRDEPYFGFKIPGEDNKFFYVWLDAPIGYMASSQNYFHEKQQEFDEFWKKESGKIVHFVGKDILYFHTLFWPAMLMGSGYQTPDHVHVHGFMTVNGEKMSKSKGTFIKAATFLQHQDPEHLRFYLACKLNNSLEDMDLNFADYSARVNADLIGNLVNIVSRVSTSILDKLDRQLGKLTPEGNEYIQKLLEYRESIESAYETKVYSRAIREITAAGDMVNRYINDKAPWLLVKEDKEKAREVVTFALNAAKILAIYLKPIVPEICSKIFKLLNLAVDTNYSHIDTILEDQKVGEYRFLSKRVDEKAIKKMIQENTQKPKEEKVKQESQEKNGYISIQDVAKVELRVGFIKEANHVEGADKLLNVKVDLGDLGVKNVFAGIKAAYTPEELLGLKVVVVANLQPRKMKFGVSEAMLLASGSGESLSLFIPHKDAKAGDLLK
ncbi:MAG: methionine--tRNA ligase [Spirochaetota bacterium]